MNESKSGADFSGVLPFFPDIKWHSTAFITSFISFYLPLRWSGQPIPLFSHNSNKGVSSHSSSTWQLVGHEEDNNFFFQGPFGRDIKTTVKTRKTLFTTFSLSYQLLFYIVDAMTYTFFVAWYQLSNTLVIEASRLCFQLILYTGLQLIFFKYCLPMTFSYKERDRPLCCSCSMRSIIVMKKDNTWGQHSSSIAMNKGIEL